MSDKHTVVISPQGDRTMTHRDELLRPDPERGPFRIRRASHIEPTAELAPAAVEIAASRHLPLRYTRDTAGYTAAELRELLPAGWWADLTPVSPVVLGPFDTRIAALQAESDWLQEHLPCLNLSTTSSSC